MFLSASEFFILGRIMTAWRIASAMSSRPYWAKSLMDTVNHVFFEFGLEDVSTPGRWSEVERREAPNDTVWQRIEGRTPDSKPHGHVDGLIPGVPALAMGVSPSVPGRLFVERTDGDACAWIVEKPRSGLYLMIMRWLKPWAGISPHLWLAMHEGSWSAVVEEWRTLPEFVNIDPHQPFADDQADGVVAAAEQEAREAGCAAAFELGGTSAEVDARLWWLADKARQADAFLRHQNSLLGDPEENLLDVLSEAVDTVRSDAVAQVCRADDGAIGFYESARDLLEVAKTPLGGPPAVSYAVDRAYGRAVQASSYLYGTFRSRYVT